ncbi:MAG: hypothetical protein Q8922_14795 [Bacteroidota bacterium]|nr:hypothetical protein [Bacteroidota bacterium]MDP4234545.1 hypothetical protein [Bacteroidota bacterium]MDP4242610.1 hypothetical protein [Bacteroidota bacterium]MDP4289186.1 hypothetical protein [Bacteroidota bacterium]
MEPLPPVKEVEYRCFISKIFEELSGSEYMTFAFETAKEFSSFRYEIAVRYRITFEPEKRLEFKVLGMTATRTMMPAFGTARSILKIPLLPFGIYQVKMIKSDGTENLFSIEVTRKGFQILQPIPRKRFIDLIVENKAAVPGSKHTSTISKTPPPPLVPRTIQKRQPTPMTPEEEALLASLKSETPQERDIREEMELFGGKKRVDKKDLEAAEKDLHKMGESEGHGHPPKPSAKRAVEEIKEEPPKHKTPAKPTPKPDVKSAPKSDVKPAPKSDVKPVAKSAAKAKPAKAATTKPAKVAKPAKPTKKVEAKKPAAKKVAAKKPVKKPAKKH